ncbi:MAG TPA: hypothetical protein VES65_07240 [Solirubrobacteraceae bacterium]|nr:hypothetical protein [Solirubrobacteraceae bacterium]
MNASHDPNPGGSLTQHLAGLVERLLKSGKAWVAIAGGLLLIALQLSWLREPLTTIGIERNTGLETSVVLVLLVTILFEVKDLARTAIPATTRQHFPDPHEMYRALLACAGSISKADERRIDVLGLTLFSAWPTISFWLQRPEVWNWTVRFATLGKDANDVQRWIPEDWLDESATIVRAIRSFATSPVAVGRNNRLELFEYDFTPSVHGFRLGNGDIFISNLLWQEDGRLGKPGFSYDYIPAHEAGSDAAAKRELFDNWFTRAISET